MGVLTTLKCWPWPALGFVLRARTKFGDGGGLLYFLRGAQERFLLVTIVPAVTTHWQGVV